MTFFGFIVVCCCLFSRPPQNYLKDAWNIFDFVTVLGSITDILVTEINVRDPPNATHEHQCIPTPAPYPGGATLSKEASRRAALY